MIRPVKQVLSGAAEMIGTLEQCHMAIRCPDGGDGGSKRLKFTHTGTHNNSSPHLLPSEHRVAEPIVALSTFSAEFSPYTMLSVVASLTPYSDFNQSPRNMYQCQMAKQTMGFPVQATEHKPENKTYRLHTPQTPLAKTKRLLMLGFYLVCF